MGKRRISGKELVADIRAGLDSKALMEKYRLTAAGLEKLINKLLDVKIIEESELRRLRSSLLAEAPSGDEPAGARRYSGKPEPAPSTPKPQEEVPRVSPSNGSGSLVFLGAVGLVMSWLATEGWFSFLVCGFLVLLLCTKLFPRLLDRGLITPAHLSGIGVALLAAVGIASILGGKGNPALGQFLGGRGGLSDSFGSYGILGIVVMGIVLTTARGGLGKISKVTRRIFYMAIVGAAIVGILVTLILQGLGGAAFNTLGLAVRGDFGTLLSSYSNSPLGRNPAVMAHLFRGGSRARPRHVLVAVAVAAVAVVVGAGYAFSVTDLSWFWHAVAFTVGVGVVEEIAKALAGMAIVVGAKSYVAKSSPKAISLNSKASEARLIIASFGIAGLGFGAGEALHYFGLYYWIQAGPWVYLMRASWCILLHGAWTITIGTAAAMVTMREHEYGKAYDPRDIAKKQPFAFFCFIFPVVSHGVYDAFAMHDTTLMYLCGLTVLSFAAYVVQRVLSEPELAHAT